MSEELRPLLFSIAYRMLGSVGDAEDVVQEAFLRAERAEADGTQIESRKAFLTTVTTRLAIDELRSARARRETYVGPWLPEPLLTSTEPDAAEHAEMADSLSISFLVLLETLSPVERAVFLLREVFDYGYDEIAEIVGKSEANCRQILVRARKRIDEGKPRFEADRRQQEELTRRFLEAFEEGDVDGLVELLADDVVFVGDGGGKGRGITRPVYGRHAVTRLLTNFVRAFRSAAGKLRLGEVNGQPGALLFDAEDRLVNVFSFEIADGAILGVRSVINPDKLDHLGYELSPYARRDS
jgi:RNA polymerase sigma-70 factor (TIGR02957 family)